MVVLFRSLSGGSERAVAVEATAWCVRARTPTSYFPPSSAPRCRWRLLRAPEGWLSPSITATQDPSGCCSRGKKGGRCRVGRPQYSAAAQRGRPAGHVLGARWHRGSATRRPAAGAPPKQKAHAYVRPCLLSCLMGIHVVLPLAVPVMPSSLPQEPAPGQQARLRHPAKVKWHARLLELRGRKDVHAVCHHLQASAGPGRDSNRPPGGLAA